MGRAILPVSITAILGVLCDQFSVDINQGRVQGSDYTASGSELGGVAIAPPGEGRHANFFAIFFA